MSNLGFARTLAWLAAASLLPLTPELAPSQERLEGAQSPQAHGGEQAPNRRSRIDPFAGQERIRALLVTGGCCHDYGSETQALIDMMETEAPVDWTVVMEVQGGENRTKTKLGIYNQPNWAEGYDIVVHNECFANVDDREFVRNIAAGHEGGPPAVVIHCAMHSYRALESDEWREFLGVTTRRHTRQHRIKVQVADPDHPVMKGFPMDWVTPMDELYVIEKLWPNASALATAKRPEDGSEHALAWVNDYEGVRVFGTTIGHGPPTWEDATFRELIVRGFKWALGRE